MMKAVAFLGTLAGTLPLLVACEQEKPVLTKEVFVQAVKTCGAEHAVFTDNQVGSRLPTIAITEGTSTSPKGAMRTSDCLAAEISSYRIEAMEIRFETPASPKAT